MALKITNKNRKKETFDMIEEVIPVAPEWVDKYLGYTVIGVLVLVVLMPFIL